MCGYGPMHNFPPWTAAQYQKYRATVAAQLAADRSEEMRAIGGAPLRTFETGATRDTDQSKYDYEGFISPEVVRAFGAYMDFNRHLPDGSLRASDNWQKGIPQDVYMKSAMRHFMDWWLHHRGRKTTEGLEWALLGLMFNLQGYLHEHIKRNPDAIAQALAAAHERRKVDPRWKREGSNHD